MSIRIRESCGISILDIEGNIDINSADIIEAVGLLAGKGSLNIIINLENVDLVDYSGLSILAVAYKSAINHKGRLIFIHVPLSVIELFKVVKLDNVLQVYPDERSAIDSFFETPLSDLHLRRRYQRLDTHITVNYSIVGGVKNLEAFEGVALNISAAGVYIYTKSIFPLNSLLSVSLTLPSANKSIETEGRVVYLADKDIQPHAFPGMGVAFMHLNTKKEKLLVEFIEKNITHRAEQL
jgi:anti-sigma B factor antagonist